MKDEIGTVLFSPEDGKGTVLFIFSAFCLWYNVQWRGDMQTFGNDNSKNLFIHLVNEYEIGLIQKEADELREMSKSTDWCLAPIMVDDWNNDLTPWNADPVFGKEGFGDGAQATLDRLINSDMSELGCDRDVFLCGYSLAGLFALWAAYQTGVFAGIVAASPSVWYPGWIGYAGGHRIMTSKAYLSLGTKEEKARNPVMARVGDCIRKQYELLESAGVTSQLDWNPGNHFVDSEKRTAKGMAWMLNG